MLELVYRATEDVVAVDPETGHKYVLAVKGEVLTPEEVAKHRIPGAPKRLRTTDATPKSER